MKTSATQHTESLSDLKQQVRLYEKKNTFISNTKKSNDEVFFLSLKLQDKIRLSEEEKVEYKKFFFLFPPVCCSVSEFFMLCLMCHFRVRTS